MTAAASGLSGRVARDPGAARRAVAGHLRHGQGASSLFPKNAGKPKSACRAPELTSGSIAISVLRMRTTLDIPEPLIEEARQLLGFKSKTDTVVLSLQELIRRKRIEELKGMMGHVRLEIDVPKSRRRPRSRP